MLVTVEMKAAVRQRRKAVWLAHCRYGKTIRELGSDYGLSDTAIRNDLYMWTQVVAKAAKVFGFPYLEVHPIESTANWRRRPKVLRLYEKGVIIRDLHEVNFPSGFDSLISLLHIRGIAQNRYPFDPDTHPYFNRKGNTHVREC
jgi:hypothetical protein